MDRYNGPDDRGHPAPAINEGTAHHVNAAPSDAPIVQGISSEAVDPSSATLPCAPPAPGATPEGPDRCVESSGQSQCSNPMGCFGSFAA